MNRDFTRRIAKPFCSLIAATLLSASLTGCVVVPAQGGSYGAQSGYSHQAYRSDQALGEMAVRYGSVKSVRPVALEQGQTGVGIVAGAALGGLAGNKIGKGNGRKAATVLGLLAGGMAGSAIESNVRTLAGEEIVVRLDSGHEVAVVQAASQSFVPGDRVRLTGSGNNVRISR